MHVSTPPSLNLYSSSSKQGHRSLHASMDLWLINKYGHCIIIYSIAMKDQWTKTHTHEGNISRSSSNHPLLLKANNHCMLDN